MWVQFRNGSWGLTMFLGRHILGDFLIFGNIRDLDLLSAQQMGALEKLQYGCNLFINDVNIFNDSREVPTDRGERGGRDRNKQKCQSRGVPTYLLYV